MKNLFILHNYGNIELFGIDMMKKFLYNYIVYFYAQMQVNDFFGGINAIKIYQSFLSFD